MARSKNVFGQGSYGLGWPFPPSASASAFYRRKKRVYTTTVGPLFPRSVARPPEVTEQKKSYGVYDFPGRTREKGIHHRSGKRVYAIEPQTRKKKKKKRISTVVVHTFFFPVLLGFFFLGGGVLWKSLHETLINTIFCVQLSQFEFPHAYALLPHPVSATKLTFETTWKMSNFRISFFEKVACHRKR